MLRLQLRPYGIVAAAVLAAYGARALLEPILRSNHPYLLFYPVVLVAAYAFGRGPAVLAAALSAALAFWTFAEPAFGVGGGAATLTPLLFFTVTCAVAIYLITALTGALGRLAADQGRLQATADAHAEMFRDLQARIGHHMGLVAGVLSFQARGEPDPEVLLLLRRAGERSQMIARAFREASGGSDATIDFAEFSRTLARMTYLESGRPPGELEIEGDSAPVPVEVATTLGVALAECLAWILRQEPGGATRLRIERAPRRLAVVVSHKGAAGSEAMALAPAAFLFRAMVEQLGASVELSTGDAEAAHLELSAPLPVEPRSAGRGATVH